MKTRFMLFLTAARADPKVRAKFYLRLLVVAAIFAVVLIGVAHLYARSHNQAIAEKQTQMDMAIEATILAEASAQCHNRYTDVKNVTVSIATCDGYALADNKEARYRKFHVYGYVFMTDLYGDQYKAKFNASVYIDADHSGFCQNFEMEIMSKESQ